MGSRYCRMDRGEPRAMHSYILRRPTLPNRPWKNTWTELGTGGQAKRRHPHSPLMGGRSGPEQTFWKSLAGRPVMFKGGLVSRGSWL